MSLAPIRGAPPGAPNPDFPTGGAAAKPAAANVTPPSGVLPQIVPRRQRGAPIEFGDQAVTLTFQVTPELPAISRAMMIVHVTAVGPGATHRPGFLQMSAAKARRFLIDLRNGRSSVVAKGDEDGTVEITFEVTGAEMVCAIRTTSEAGAWCCCVIDRTFDITSMADELLGDLGA